MEIAFAPNYLLPLPPGHRFPMLKYELIPEQLLHEGIITNTDLHSPDPVNEDIIIRTHKQEYWERVRDLKLSPAEIRRIGFPLSRELDVLLENGDTYLQKGNVRDALALSKGLLRPVMELFTYADDSSGSLGTTAHLAIELIGKVAAASQASAPLIQELYDFLEKELSDSIYFDYGDFGYDLFDIFQQQAVIIGNEDGFIRFVDAATSKLNEEYGTHQREFLVKQKIHFYHQTGKLTQAEELISQHMEIEDIRMIRLEIRISQKNFTDAKNLINEGIRIARAKKHPGTIAQWEKQLLRIAKLEKDIAAIRHYTKKFAFDRGLSTEYYREWKATFTKTEWTKEIEEHIAATIDQQTEKWMKMKGHWKPDHPPLLDHLGRIYIEEKYWDRLLPLVQQRKTLRTILDYHSVLVRHYPSQLLEIYLPALEEYAIEANGRNDYQYLVKTMQDVIREIPEGKEKIIALAAALKQRFLKKPRRPALVEELGRLS
ncbi:MAG: hypothetical protein EOP49_05875 [Sphingobacteriales bacterium]|nr:MAG: hypothetical protein EOP49_05875 [Sphingobacteriales bacterium]